MLASVKGCLTYFQNGVRNLSINYKHHKDEDKRPGEDDYTFENAIESVLTEFHLSREQIRYLKPIVMGGRVKSRRDRKDSNGKMSLKYFDRSVYDRGFRYYDFIDDPNHSMRSEIQLFDFQDSPERILLHLSEKAQVVGISATATLDTVVGNYDLEYLPIKLLAWDKICNIRHRGMLLSCQLMIMIEEIWKRTLTVYILRSRHIFW